MPCESTHQKPSRLFPPVECLGPKSSASYTLTITPSREKWTNWTTDRLNANGSSEGFVRPVTAGKKKKSTEESKPDIRMCGLLSLSRIGGSDRIGLNTDGPRL